MKKILLGTAAAALTVISASPASAQYYDRYRSRSNTAEDIAVGVAVVGGVAAILGALDRDGGRYGYGYGSRDRYRNDYRDNYGAAVNSCGAEAQREGQGGRVRITDVSRSGGDRYRVEGVVESGYGGGYGGRYDRNDGRDGGRYDSREYSRDYGERFTCVAFGNGRIADFRMRDGYASRTRSGW
jgi:hypothetical protein